VQNVQSITVTLNNASIKTLPTIPVDLVAAPGAGKILVPISALFVLDTAAGAYTNLGTTTKAGWQLYSDSSSELSSILEMVTPLGGTTAFTCQAVIPRAQVGTTGYTGEITSAANPLADRSNKSIQLVDFWTDGGNYTGGNAANTVKITIFYAIVNQ
jgi:hypothetical protein